jgi:hypothetical protein
MNFERADETMINNRRLVRGTELTIYGEGRFKFLGVVRNVDTGAEWIDCVSKDHKLRSFRVDKVKRVHYKNKMGR